MKLGKSYVTCVTPENNWLPTKLLYTVNRIRMSPTPTLNIYLFEGPIEKSSMDQLTSCSGENFI
jgi:hypothetical protein